LDELPNRKYLPVMGWYSQHVLSHFTLAEFIAKTPATVTSDKQVTLTIVLALATLGCTTQIGLFLFLVVTPKVAKARTYSVAVADVFTKNASPM
jgi:hypothetical protein